MDKAPSFAMFSQTNACETLKASAWSENTFDTLSTREQF